MKPRITLKTILTAAYLFGCAVIPLTGYADDTTAASASAPGAGDTSVTIGEVVVTATKIKPEDITDVLTSVNILGGDIAQRQNVNNAFQLFELVPGVLTENFNQGTTNGAISMRGFNGEGSINPVKLLIDGVPSNDDQGFTPFLDEIFPLEISQIAVVEGTSDARYGLNNIAGNVDISTRQGGNYTDSQVIGGSWGTYDVQSAVGYQQRDLSQNYFAAYRHTDGAREHDAQDRWTVGGKWFEQIGTYDVGLISRFYQATAQEPGYLTAAQDAANPNATNPWNSTDGDKRRLAQVSLHADGDITNEVSSSAILYYNRIDDQRFVTFAANLPQLEREAQENQYGGIASMRYTPHLGGPIHKLVIEGGGEFHLEDNAFQQYDTMDRTRYLLAVGQSFTLDNYGGYIQAVIEPWEWLKITPAYRADNVSGHFQNSLSGERYPFIDYGTIGQPKFSVAATLPAGLLLYGNYGRTFQIGLGSSAYLIPPQTNIKPSVNDGFEVGVKYALSDWFQGRVDAWQQTASGEIQYDELTLQETNLGKTRRRGYDIQASVKPTRQFHIWLSISGQRGVILQADPANTGEVDGNTIDHVPQFMVSGGIEYDPTDKLHVTFTSNGQSSYQLDTSDSHGTYGNYSKFNLDLLYLVVPHIELGFEVKNLSNSRHVYAWWDGSEVLEAPADGRAYYGSVRARW